MAPKKRKASATDDAPKKRGRPAKAATANKGGGRKGAAPTNEDGGGEAPATSTAGNAAPNSNATSVPTRATRSAVRNREAALEDYTLDQLEEDQRTARRNRGLLRQLPQLANSPERDGPPQDEPAVDGETKGGATAVQSGTSARGSTRGRGRGRGRGAGRGGARGGRGGTTTRGGKSTRGGRSGRTRAAAAQAAPEDGAESQTEPAADDGDDGPQCEITNPATGLVAPAPPLQLPQQPAVDAGATQQASTQQLGSAPTGQAPQQQASAAEAGSELRSSNQQSAPASRSQAPPQRASGTGSGRQAFSSQQSGDQSSSSGRKRSREGEVSGGKAAKKAKGNESDQSATQTAPPEVADPCAEVTRQLNSHRPQPGATIRGPARRNRALGNEFLGQAIASVTEAVTQRGGASFSLLDPDILVAALGELDSVRPIPNAGARLGNETLVPFTTQNANRGHHSLYILGRGGDGNFTFQQFDTARNFSAHRNNVGDNGRRISDTLHRFGWPRNDPAIPPATNATHAGRQRSGTECGVLVILFAWAYALGLNFSAFTQVEQGRQNVFAIQATDLINLAIAGNADSETIRNFLRCYGIIPADAQVPEGRRFQRTVAFRTLDELRVHILRLRLIEDIGEILRRRGHAGEPTPETIFETQAAVLEDVWQEATAETYVDMAGFPQASSQTSNDHNSGDGRPPGDHEPPPPPPGAGGPSSGGPAEGGGSSKGKDKGKAPAKDSSAGKGSEHPKGRGRQNGSPKGKGMQGTAATDTSQATGSQAGQDQPPNDPDFCREFRTSLTRLQAGHSPTAIQDPVERGEMLVNSTVNRAIAAVTEAISERNAVRFSIIDDTDFQRARTGGGVVQHLGRPGQVAFLPFYPEDSHSSLFILQHTLTRNFVLVHYDSAASNGHRGHAEATNESLTSALRELGWYRNPGRDPVVGDPGEGTCIAQMGNWECGLHVILNAWIYALGLTPTGTNTMGRNRYNNDFLPNAVTIVNLAMEGRMDSRTIAAFLRCFGLVYGGIVPAERTFLHTIPLQNPRLFMDRVARVRLQGDLDAIEARNPTGMPTVQLDFLLALLPEANDSPDLTEVTAQGLLDTVIHAQTLHPRASPANHVPPSQPSIPPAEMTSSERRIQAVRAAGVSEAEIRHSIARGRRGASSQDNQGPNAESSPSRRQGRPELTQMPQRKGDEDKLVENVDDGSKEPSCSNQKGQATTTQKELAALPSIETTQPTLESPSSQVNQSTPTQDKQNAPSLARRSPARPGPLLTPELAPYNNLIQRLVDEYLQTDEHDEKGPSFLMDRAVAWHEGRRQGFANERALEIVARETLRRWSAANPDDDAVADAIAIYTGGHMGLRHRARETLAGLTESPASSSSSSSRSEEGAMDSEEPNLVGETSEPQERSTNEQTSQPQERPSNHIPHQPGEQPARDESRSVQPRSNNEVLPHGSEERHPDQITASLQPNNENDRRSFRQHPDRAGRPSGSTLQQMVDSRLGEGSSSSDRSSQEALDHLRRPGDNLDQLVVEAARLRNRLDDISARTQEAICGSRYTAISHETPDFAEDGRGGDGDDDDGAMQESFSDDDDEKERRRSGRRRRPSPLLEEEYSDWEEEEDDEEDNDYEGGGDDDDGEEDSDDDEGDSDDGEGQVPGSGLDGAADTQQRSSDGHQESNPDEDDKDESLGVDGPHTLPPVSPLSAYNGENGDPLPSLPASTPPALDDREAGSLFGDANTPRQQKASAQDGRGVANARSIIDREPPPELLDAMNRLPGLPPVREELNQLLAIDPSAPNYAELLDEVVNNSAHQSEENISPRGVASGSAPQAANAGVDAEDTALEQALRQELEKEHSENTSVTSESSRRQVDVFSGTGVGEEEQQSERRDRYRDQQRQQGDFRGSHPHHHRRSESD